MTSGLAYGAPAYPTQMQGYAQIQPQSYSFQSQGYPYQPLMSLGSPGMGPSMSTSTSTSASAATSTTTETSDWSSRQTSLVVMGFVFFTVIALYSIYMYTKQDDEDEEDDDEQGDPGRRPWRRPSSRSSSSNGNQEEAQEQVSGLRNDTASLQRTVDELRRDISRLTQNAQNLTQASTSRATDIVKLHSELLRHRRILETLQSVHDEEDKDSRYATYNSETDADGQENSSFTRGIPPSAPVFSTRRISDSESESRMATGPSQPGVASLSHQ